MQLEVKKSLSHFESRKYPESTIEDKVIVEKALQYFNLDDESIAGIWNESQTILNAITDLNQVNIIKLELAIHLISMTKLLDFMSLLFQCYLKY